MSNAGKVESGDTIAQPCHAHVNFNRSGLQYDTKCRCSISWRAVDWNPGVRESVLATVRIACKSYIQRPSDYC